MVELATALGVLSMFLGWRLFIVSERLWVANRMLRGILLGEVILTKTEDGFEMEVKQHD